MSYVGSVTGITNQGPNLVSLTLPAFPNPRGGQVLILVAFEDPTNGLASGTIPAGYTQIGPQLSGLSSMSFILCKKLGTSADSGATIQGGFNTAWYQTGVARVYDGVGDVDQIGTADTSGNTNINVPALSSLQVPGELIVAFYAGRGGTAAFTAPSGWVNEVDVTSNARSGIGSSDTVQPGSSQSATTAANANGGNWSSFAVSVPQMSAIRQYRAGGVWVNKPLRVRAGGVWV